MDKPTPVTGMQFAVTPKDHTVAIANKGSLVMDSIAPVRIQITMHVKPLQLWNAGFFGILIFPFLSHKPRTGCSLGCAPGCDAGGREFETPTGPTLRVFK